MNFIYCFSPSQHNTSNNNFINVRWFLFLKRSYANIDFILFFWFPEVQPPARRRRRRQQLHQHRLHRPGEIDDDWQLKYVDFCFFSAPTPAPDHGHDNFSTLSFIGGMVNLIQFFLPAEIIMICYLLIRSSHLVSSQSDLLPSSSTKLEMREITTLCRENWTWWMWNDCCRIEAFQYDHFFVREEMESYESNNLIFNVSMS